MSRTRTTPLATCVALALTASSCFFGADGREPPLDQFYFPTGVVASPGGTTLYVSNSDFDLRYSAGTLMAINLIQLRYAVTPIAETLAAGGSGDEACVAVKRLPNPNPWLHPGPCDAFPLSEFRPNAAYIGAFASGLLLTHEPGGDGARLFSPVRGDPSITYFDVTDDRGAAPVTAFDPLAEFNSDIDCGQGAGLFCGGLHRIGQDPDRNLRGIQLPADPVGIAASADGRAIIAAHQTQGAASLVVNDWDSRPELTFFTQGLPAGPTEVAAIPEPAFVEVVRGEAQAAGETFVYRPGYTVTFRATSEVNVLRYVDDGGSVPPRPFIQREAAVPIITNASSFDSRGVAIVDRERRACEESCSGEATCLVACAETIPLRIFMSNRDPAALLLGEVRTFVNRATDESGTERITSATEQVLFYDSLPLDFGASRVEVGQIVDASGALVDRVFAVAFDTRRLFIVDPFATRVEAVVRTGRGPHDVGFDTGVDGNGEPYSFLYVGHFTDSYLGVVDLDQRRATTFGNMIATIGIPNEPREGT